MRKGEQAMARKRTSVWTKILMGITALCCVATLVSQRVRLLEKQKELDSLMDQAAALSQEVASLEQDAEEADTPEGIRRIARDQLGLADPGEILLVDTQD